MSGEAELMDDVLWFLFRALNGDFGKITSPRFFKKILFNSKGLFLKLSRF